MKNDNSAFNLNPSAFNLNPAVCCSLRHYVEAAQREAEQVARAEVRRCKLDPSLKAPYFQPFNLRLRTSLST